MDHTNQDIQFAEWLEKHRLILHKVANAFATGADRDDLMQEMCVSLWKALPAFRGDSRESTFTYRVVHNCALTWVRGQSRRRDRENKAHEEHARQTGGPGHDNTRLELLYECIRDLPAVDRSIITMSLDGLSHAEIALIVLWATYIEFIRYRMNETIRHRSMSQDLRSALRLTLEKAKASSREIKILLTINILTVIPMTIASVQNLLGSDKMTAQQAISFVIFCALIFGVNIAFLSIQYFAKLRPQCDLLQRRIESLEA